jgi:endoglucanase
MGSISDPDDNFLFEVHQYLDENYSGSSPDIDHDPVVALTAFTEWLQLTGNRGFLGEFGVAEGAPQQAALTAMLNYVQQNSSVWDGWTWWAGGPWWDLTGQNYMFNLDPVGGVDAPQMAYLEPFLAVPEPSTWCLLAFGGIALFVLRRRGAG